MPALFEPSLLTLLLLALHVKGLCWTVWHTRSWPVAGVCALIALLPWLAVGEVVVWGATAPPAVAWTPRSAMHTIVVGTMAYAPWATLTILSMVWNGRVIRVALLHLLTAPLLLGSFLLDALA